MKKLVLLLTLTLTGLAAYADEAAGAYGKMKDFGTPKASTGKAGSLGTLQEEWPEGSTVYPGKYVIGPNKPGTKPGQCTGEILATGSEATLHPRVGPPDPQKPLGLIGRLLNLFKR